MREYALVFLVAAAVTFLLTSVVRRFAMWVGAMAAPRDRDVHVVPTPRLGGLAMYGGVLAAFVVAGHLPTLRFVGQRYDDPTAVLVAGAVICALGAIDDRWELDALTKLAGQIGAAGVMVLLGVRLYNLVLPGVHSELSLTDDVSVPLTVVFAVLLVNAINFIDGLDGLAAGVVAIAALASFTFSYSLSHQHNLLAAQPATLIAATLAGVCVGFLPHNFTPARIFMGDSGSMLIGLMLAASTTSITGEVDYAGAGLATSLPLLVPVLVPILVLAVPFVDLMLAIIRRTRAGRSPFSPDKHHLHHRLLEIGHSQRRAVLLMYSWAALLGFGGVLVSVSHSLALPLSLMAGLATVGLIVAALPRLRRRSLP